MFKALRARLAPTPEVPVSLLALTRKVASEWDDDPYTCDSAYDHSPEADARRRVEFINASGLADYISLHPLREGDYVDDDGAVVRAGGYEPCGHWTCYED